MKKSLITALNFGCSILLAVSALAVNWPTDASYRVQAMGSAALAIEDESTDLTLFNHENLAGLALNPKMNRFDMGISYESNIVDTATVEKVTSTNLALTRPGAQYRGITYWVDDSLVVRGGLEGMTVSIDTVPVGGTSQKLNYSALGGGVSAAWKSDFGLVLGAGAMYIGAGGKPDPLPAGTKQDLSANNFNWGVGAGYAIPAGEKSRLSLGVQVGADDERPIISPSLMDFRDFSAITDIVSTTPFGDFTQKTTYTSTPLRVGGEAIFDLDNKMLQAGLLIDGKTRDLSVKFEQVDPSGGFLGGTFSSESLKYQTDSSFSFTPVVRGNLPLGEDLNLLPGIEFSTFGTGTITGYVPTGLNTVGKAFEGKITSSLLTAGIGLQAMKKQLQLAFQIATASPKIEQATFDPVSGVQIGSTITAPDQSIVGFAGGAEFWFLPEFALRAGYNTSTNTIKNPAPVGETSSTAGTITFGAGYLAAPNGLAIDLLVELTTLTHSPAPTPTTTDNTMGIFVGGRIPI